MKSERHQFNNSFWVTIIDEFDDSVTVYFPDIESQTAFCAALDNALDVEEVENDTWSKLIK